MRETGINEKISCGFWEDGSMDKVLAVQAGGPVFGLTELKAEQEGLEMVQWSRALAAQVQFLAPILRLTTVCISNFRGSDAIYSYRHCT